MDDVTSFVRQIAQYPHAEVVAREDVFLLQQGGLGGPYRSVDLITMLSSFPGISVGIFPPRPHNGVLANFVTTPLGVRQGFNWYVDNTGLQRYLQNGVAGQWMMDGGVLSFSISPAGTTDQQVWPFSPLFEIGYDGNLKIAQQITVARGPVLDNEVVTKGYLQLNTVTAFNGRQGAVCLTADDLSAALCLPPDDAIATSSSICKAIESWYYTAPFVFTFMGRLGDVVLTADDVTFACTAPGAMPRSSTPPLGDASSRIATTGFVDEGLTDLYDQIQADIASIIDLSAYAPLNSPNFTGLPTGPTANPGTSTGQLATTAFVQAAVTASTTGVASFNGRTGAITLLLTDVTGAGGAPINSPSFTGTPLAPTPTAGDSSQKLATTAFVETAIGSISTGVSSFNTRTGAVVLSTADVMAVGAAPINSPSFTGVPLAPTAVPGTNTTQLATTAFVAAAVSTLGGVTSFNSRTGAITLLSADVSAAGGALIASPSFTGTPLAPTAAPGTSTTQLATTAFVAAAITASGGVLSFNGRAGAVTLSAADISIAGGALLGSPNFTGVPTAPTAAQTSNDTTIATTAYVRAALAGATLVTSFNSRSGAVTLNSSDVSAAGGALIASPTFTGTPAAPTAAANTSTTQLATTAFVMAQLASAGGVTSWNGRAGVVTMTTADITGAGGASAQAYNNAGRNLFDNAQMRVFQRGAGPVSGSTSGAVYSADRWGLGISLASDSATSATLVLTDTDRSQLADEAAIWGLQTVFTGSSSASGAVNAFQRIEYAEATSNKQVTLSFWAKASSGTPKIGIGYFQNFGSGGSTGVGGNLGVTTNLTTTWTRYVFTGTLPSAAGKTMGTGNFTQFDFWFSDQGSFSARSGGIGVQSGTVQIWGPQLEFGATATPLEKLALATDLQRCQRFYCQGTLSFVWSVSTAGPLWVPVWFPVTMRVKPTMGAALGSNVNWTYSSLTAADVNQATFVGTSTNPNTYTQMAGTWQAFADL